MDMVYTNADGVEQGYIPGFTLDLAYGVDENDFALTLPYGFTLPNKAYAYIDGTEFGGIVRGGGASTMDEAPVSKATGRTWHGMLAESIICPSAGQTHVSVSGDANIAIASVVARQGLSSVFDVATEPSGIAVNCQFARFVDAYKGLCSMLASVGAKLKIDKQPGCKPCLYAAEAKNHVDQETSDRYAYSIKTDTPINHLVCIGAGEMLDRAVIHLYADLAGNTSKTQTLFGLDERTQVYELSSAEIDELEAEGRRHLIELQSTSSIDLRIPDGESFDVGDTVGLSDDVTGLIVTATVTKVIATVDERGILAVTNEIGDINAKRK